MNFDEFQERISHLLIRNTNILDILTKCSLTSSKMCRSTVKSATGCGCIEIKGEKLPLDFDGDYKKLLKSSGINGRLCPDCRASVESEIGEMLFYMASLCNCLGLSLKDIMLQEVKRVESLGKYSLH